MEKIEKPRLDIMLDIETTSKQENAGILSISFFPFNKDNSETGVEPFYVKIDALSCFLAGMHFCPETQTWWQSQSEEAKAELIIGDHLAIITAISKAYQYLEALSMNFELVMWSRGMDFDFPKLEWCFRRFLQKEPPYKYYNKRDARTVIKESEIDEAQFEFVGVKHSALDDNKHQIKLVQAASKK